MGQGRFKAAGKATTNYFDTNPYAQNIGQGVEGALGMVGMYSNISNQINDIRDAQFDIPLMESNPYERPDYKLGAAFGAMTNYDPETAGKGMIGSSIAAGASSGAAIGSMGGPWGTAIGAGAGAITGLVSGIFGKDKARREARAMKTREKTRLSKAQKGFNVEATAFDSNMDARDSYNKRLTNRRRNIQRAIG